MTSYLGGIPSERNPPVPDTSHVFVSMKNDLIFMVLGLMSGVFLAQTTMASYRIRSPLLRMVHDRMIEEARDRQCDHSQWYAVNTNDLAKDLASRFVQCNEDQETSEFLESCSDKADWILTQMTHMFLKSLLSWFMNQTSINGLLRRGSMFVYSKKQFQSLLGIDENWKTGSLLDLGAGDGRVTEKMAGHFENVFATEASKPMVWRLQELGYSVLSLEEWADGTRTYDLISCLNLLDRCERPVSLLHDMKRALRPGSGRIIVAVVIPFRPYVEFGGMDHKPFEYLHINGTTFEEQVQSFVFNVLAPAGLRVESFTRLPYLCEGDLTRNYYILDDVVFVLKPS